MAMAMREKQLVQLGMMVSPFFSIFRISRCLSSCQSCVISTF